ncbi:RNHCP domain-containing protein [Streptomyces albus subsp. chlorinus]|uniref:RNHCP domain-containing protein n=1 Tax=Streptomyces albus TaxID=1888 RepID=UPI00156DE3D9|nr:RNHCP domain-containing protein [Streptomyces albus subsp. chlorinus]
MSSTDNARPSDHHNSLKLDTFACVWCGLTVNAVAADGRRRNHCPSCLHSQHTLDHADGGPSQCRSRMTPISIAVLRDGAWRVIHRCVRCDQLTSNPVCADDNQLILMRMAVRPLAQPPFPLEAFGDL